MNTRLHTLITLFVAGLMASACGSNGAVNDLAKRTGGNMVNLAGNLDNFAKVGRQTTDRRIAGLSEQARNIEEERLRLDRAILIAKHVKRSDEIKRLEEIRALADQLAALEADRLAKMRQNETSIRSAQSKLETDADAFREIGAQLLTLSKDSSGLANAKFLIGFAKDVSDRLEQAQKDAKQDSGVSN